MKLNIKGTICTNNHAMVYDWLGFDHSCPRHVNDTISKCAPGERLDVYINSGGGDVFSAVEMADAIRNYSGETAIHITGIAASAATIIMCAGNSDISPGSMIMVHNASSYAEGDCNVMGHEAEVLKKVNRAIATAYINKSGMSEAEALEMMNIETWLNADKAVEKRLIDKIAVPEPLQVAAALNEMLPQSVIDKVMTEIISKEHEDKSKSLLDIDIAQARLNLLKLKNGGM